MIQSCSGVETPIKVNIVEETIITRCLSCVKWEAEENKIQKLKLQCNLETEGNSRK